MATLLLDAQGRPIPQILNHDEFEYIPWKGKNGAGDVNVKELPPVTGEVAITTIPQVIIEAMPSVTIAGTPSVSVNNAVAIASIAEPANYDAGEVTTTDDFLGTAITLSNPLKKMKFFVKADSKLVCNGESEEIFLPANHWTQLDFVVSNFDIKTITGSDTAYWQGVY